MQVTLSSSLMVLVGLITAFIAKRKWRIDLKWLWCGGLLWAVAVGAKILISMGLSAPVLKMLKSHLAYPLFLIFGSSYIGLLTGLTEVVFTLAAGLVWRKLAQDAPRAVGIGLGAGALEAICLGLAAPLLGGGAAGPSGLSLAVLLPVIERILCIPSHAAVRTMSLYTVATGRWSWFWWAFVMFSAIDGGAGFYHLHGRSSISYLVAEFIVVGAAVTSVFLLGYLWKHWPAQSNKPDAEEPAIAFPFQTEVSRRGSAGPER